jgi:hypothetical protein
LEERVYFSYDIDTFILNKSTRLSVRQFVLRKVSYLGRITKFKFLSEAEQVTKEYLPSFTKEIFSCFEIAV